VRESTRVPAGHKWCNIGLHAKPLGEFGRNSQRLDGRMGACRECVNNANRQSYWRGEARRGRSKPRPPDPVPEGRKRCTKGGHVKPLSEFRQRTDQPGKYESACRECVNGARRKPRPVPAPPGHKRCNSGEHVKPISEFAPRSDGHGDGYVAKCRQCEREYRRRRFHEPTTRTGIEAAHARWRAKRPTYQADYYKQNRERIIAQTAAYSKAHPVDPERQREYGRLWYANNPEKAQEKARRSNSRRRARLAGLPFENYTLDDILERDGINCVLCDEPLDLDAVAPAALAPTVEHLECISWPDSAGDVFSNVAAAHSTCNCKRHNNTHPAAARKRAELLAAERVTEPV
jgi:hypothetical protein